MLIEFFFKLLSVRGDGHISETLAHIFACLSRTGIRTITFAVTAHSVAITIHLQQTAPIRSSISNTASALPLRCGWGSSTYVLRVLSGTMAGQFQDPSQLQMQVYWEQACSKRTSCYQGTTVRIVGTHGWLRYIALSIVMERGTKHNHPWVPTIVPTVDYASFLSPSWWKEERSVLNRGFQR